MLFLFKKPLIYSWKYYKILWFTCLSLGIFAQLVTLIPLAKAEGSRELVQQGGNRPYLLFGNEDSNTAGIFSQATLKVFVKAGETVHLGSSVENSAEINGEVKDIVYRWPSSNPPLVETIPGSGNFDTTGSGSFDVDGTSCGLISTLDQEAAGPFPSSGGYTPCSFQAQDEGVYEIEFHAPEYLDTSRTINLPDSKLTTEQFFTGTDQKTAISAWDITVIGTSGQEIPGRVYANYLPLGTKGTSDEINSQLVILSKVGHQYQIDLNGIQPKTFILFANNKGFTDTSNQQLFKSVWQKNAPTGVDSIETGEIKVYHPGVLDDPENITHKIFLNPPANDLPSSANTPGGSTWLLSTPPNPPTVSNFTFTGIEGTPNQAGTTDPKGGQFSFEASRAGNYILTIDVNQNGDFGDDFDRVLTGPASVGANSLAWDGLDGQGNILLIGVYQAKLVLSTDEVHFPFFDVEKNPNGLIINRLTFCSGVCDVVYYDDSDIDGVKRLDGESSSGGAHVFVGNNQGFGNDKGIDTWTSITAEPSSPLDINIKEVNLEVIKTHSPNNPFPGGAVTYTITVKSKDGPFSDVTGIRVEDAVHNSITGVTWDCTVTPVASGNNCAQASGTGNIDTTVNLKKGAIATFILQGIISDNLADGDNIDNTVTITTPNDVTNDSGDSNEPDGKTESDEEPITLDEPPSQPPVANNDSASTPANTPITIPVLGNDTDDNNSLDETSVNVTTPPNNGTTPEVINGAVKYTPNTNFSGTDTFSYKVCDTDGLCDLATVTITITSLEPPPPPPPPPKKLLSVTINGKGTVTSNPGRIDCHIIIGICALGFETNTLVTLSAEPDPGWEFKEWQQDCNNNGEVTLDSDKECTAVFDPIPLPPTILTVSITGHGSVTAITPPGGIDCGDDCSSEYAQGTSVVLKATPATGWNFKDWQGDCDKHGKVTLETDKQCQAIFTPKLPPLFQVTVYKTGQGTVISEPSGIECGETCSAQYGGSQDVRLIPTPAIGWIFEGWRGHCDDQGQVTSLEINRQCRAIFTADVPSSFQVTVYKTGQGKVISEPSGIECGKTCSAPYDGSQKVQLIVIPDPGWKFEGWRGHCDKNSGQVVRNNISYDHAQCRAIFLPDSSSPSQPKTPTGNLPPTGSNANDQNNQPQQLLDEDSDGILTPTENAAPNNGDGNNDGISDSQQNNVISLPSGEQYVTVEETNGCVINQVQAVANDPNTPAAIDLNLNCSEANITTYYHGISDLHNALPFQSVPSDSNPNITQWQAMPVTHDTIMIQGQPVAVESFSLSDGGIGDSIAGDGKITHTSGHGPLPTTNGTLPTTTYSPSETNSLSDNTTGSVSNIIGQEIDYLDHNNSPNDAVPSTISHCLSPSPTTTTQSLSWNQIIPVGETTTIALDTGSKEFFIQAIPDPNLVSVEGWQFLNGKMELSLTGLNTGDTQMILSDSNSSQPAILYLTVIAISSPVEPVLPPVEKSVTTLQTVVPVGQNVDLVVKGGQGSLSITQMPDSSLALLTNWQSHTDGTANFTLTGLNAGNTSLAITDGTTPPQKTHVNINILIGKNQPVTDPPPKDNVGCQGDTLGIDLEGHLNQACFIGNIMSWGDLRSNPRRFTATEAQNTRVTATVLISSEDIGKTAQILLVGQHTNSNGETTRYIRDDSRDQYSWERWNGQITQIPPSQYYPQLPEIIDIFIYEGDLSKMPGEFTVYVGYQLLSDNTVIYNGLKPIQFWVSNN